MTKEERIAKVQEMIDAPSCCADLKEAGKAYLAAVGTDKEAEAQAALVAEMKEDVCAIDDVMAFFASERNLRQRRRRKRRARIPASAEPARQARLF